MGETDIASTFRALRHRNFRLFWFAQMISLAGTWMQITGQAWLVVTLTNSPFRLGLISTVQWLPVLILSLYAGVVADRLPKRKILIVTQSALSLLAFVVALLVLTGRVRYWHLLVAATLAGTAQAFDMPTRQAFIVEMTSKEDLLNAIALNSSIFNLARVVGPALAGVVIEAVGTGWAFFLNGVSFFGVIYAFFAMTGTDRVTVSRRDITGDILTGLRYIRSTPFILGLMILLGVVSAFSLNFNVLVPLLAKDVLRGDSRLYGLLMSVMGSGALLGSLSLATFGGRGARVRTILAAVTALGLSEGALLLARQPGPPGVVFSAATLFASGSAMVAFSTSANTAIQTAAPDELRGRVMSVHTLVFMGVTPLGALLTGTLAEHLGTPPTFGIAGAVALAAAAAMAGLGLLRTEAPAGDGSPCGGGPAAGQGEPSEAARKRRETAPLERTAEDACHSRQSYESRQLRGNG